MSIDTETQKHLEASRRRVTSHAPFELKELYANQLRQRLYSLYERLIDGTAQVNEGVEALPVPAELLNLPILTTEETYRDYIDQVIRMTFRD